MDAYNNAKTVVTGVVDDLKKEVATVSAVDPDAENEADEPLLVENKNRFVLFPIKYHEVSSIHCPCLFHVSRGD